MSYFHMFYGVDLQQLQGLYGSNDGALLAQLLLEAEAEILDNDAFFEDYDDDPPTTAELLREIIAGEVSDRGADWVAAMYGYALKIICEYWGRPIAGNVYCVADLPMDSQLADSGPPVPIPYHGDFPVIDFLALDDIPTELQRVEERLAGAANESASSTGLVGAIARWLLPRRSHREAAEQADNEEVLDELRTYRDVLKSAFHHDESLVSFRH